eukprot:GFYU01002486.1.p2 GENE.GFYU01002486.1~~GFYU01002486.1.p2  ORF type:complete len:472 (+),score=70.76 GFYU01002486.1:196-1611(+)
MKTYTHVSETSTLLASQLRFRSRSRSVSKWQRDKIVIGHVNLHFPEPHETEFRKWFFKESLVNVRLDVLLLILVFSFMGLNDYLMLSSLDVSMVEHYVVRYAVVLPVGLGVFFYTFHPSFPAAMKKVLSLNLILTGCLTVYLLMISPSDLSVRDTYFTGILRLMWTISTSYGLSFFSISAILWFMYIFYLVFALLTARSAGIVLVEGLDMLVGVFLGMLVSNIMERLMRRNFLWIRDAEITRGDLIETKTDTSTILAAIFPGSVLNRLSKQCKDDWIIDKFNETIHQWDDTAVLKLTLLPARDMLVSCEPGELTEKMVSLYDSIDALCKKLRLDVVRHVYDSMFVLPSFGGSTAAAAAHMAQFAVEVGETIRAFNWEGTEKFNYTVVMARGTYTSCVIGPNPYCYAFTGSGIEAANAVERVCPHDSVLVTEEVKFEIGADFNCVHHGELCLHNGDSTDLYHLMPLSSQQPQ